MFRIRYAARLVVDARPDAPIRAHRQKQDSFSYYDSLVHAFRQAVNDLHHGRIVLGIEELRPNGEVKRVAVDAVALHAGLARARAEIERLEGQGFGPKRARQIAMRALKRAA